MTKPEPKPTKPEQKKPDRPTGNALVDLIRKQLKEQQKG